MYLRGRRQKLSEYPITLGSYQQFSYHPASYFILCLSPYDNTYCHCSENSWHRHTTAHTDQSPSNCHSRSSCKNINQKIWLAAMRSSVPMIPLKLLEIQPRHTLCLKCLNHIYMQHVTFFV
ncbi:hypothetical protein GDO78_017996 [Eleutherodactylus coqui]|uniref:Uncharacterized protein n=1 Tax=Eleutherodactylus coqui TaxID=57060 RepID=A0A8J6EK06_ELECQ|nr:hypothetical protein GDO78_017996 [Eleutherodactylus coqui]